MSSSVKCEANNFVISSEVREVDSGSKNTILLNKTQTNMENQKTSIMTRSGKMVKPLQKYDEYETN